MLGQPMAPPQRGATQQTPSARPRNPGMGVRPAAPGSLPPMRPAPPGQMQTAGPPIGAMQGLPGAAGRFGAGMNRFRQGMAEQNMPVRPSMPSPDMGSQPPDIQRQLMAMHASADQQAQAGPDIQGAQQQMQQALAASQARMGQMGQLQRPAMQSIGPPPPAAAGPGGYDQNRMQQVMQNANMQRDRFNQANAMGGGAGTMQGRQMDPAMLQRIQQMRQMQG
jgi:hypothetical protein